MGKGGGLLTVFTLIKKRLFTEEDYPHRVFGMHKILGIGCLLHFIARFMIAPSTTDMGFDSSLRTLGLMSMHAGLSLSSIIFKIPKKRIVEGSRIWPEYRLHSIIFACRSLACMLLIWLEQKYELPPMYEANIAIIFATIAAADIATWSVGECERFSFFRFQLHAAHRYERAHWPVGAGVVPPLAHGAPPSPQRRARAPSRTWTRPPGFASFSL